MKPRDPAANGRQNVWVTKRHVEHAHIRRSIVTGWTVFLAGFGMMNVLWWLGDWPADLPGPWAYRSTTIGDGLLLPIAASILVGVGAQLPRTAHEVLIAITAGVLGAAAGVIVMLLWLRNPDPQLNWQQTVPHRFNVAGWYHAAFMIIAASFFAASSMRVLWRARSLRITGRVRSETILHRPAATILLACALGFVGLVTLDSYPARATASGLAPAGAVLVGATVLIALLMWSFGHGALRAWRSLGLSILAAAALCLCAWPLFDPISQP